MLQTNFIRALYMFFAICWSFNAGSGILHAPLCCSPFLSLVPGLQNETLLKLCFRNIGLCQFFPFFFFFLILVIMMWF